MSSPFLVKGVGIVRLPSNGVKGRFAKVPKSPPPVGRNNYTPIIATRIPICDSKNCTRRKGHYGRCYR